ncbi:MAG: hypothetical protein MSA65_02900 [Mollicutes bacterium]|nr:hypothetical protein [Mollicutes bacterium]
MIVKFQKKIEFINDCNCIVDYEEQHWGTLLDMNEIEYLKIEPMLEKEND